MADRCPGCGGKAGNYRVATRMFDVDAKSGDDSFVCKSCHARADVIWSKYRKRDENWAGKFHEQEET